jgi:hypothetical protein
MTVPVDIFLADSIATSARLPSFNSYRTAYVYRLSLDSARTDAELLEEAFRVLNVDHPPDYKERSLSMGDVVTINKSRSYRCSMAGWQQLERPLLPRRGLREAIHWLLVRKRKLQPLFARLVCRLRGCAAINNGACACCRVFIYDPEFVRTIVGLYQIANPIRLLKYTCMHRCAICRQRIWFTQDQCCSADCWDEWYPF